MGQTSKKQDWTPTEQAFRRFLEWLDEGRDSRGERYVEMRKRLVRYFDQKQCHTADDLADETLNRVARRLEEAGTITDATPAHYCYIVAKFVFLEHLRAVRPASSGEDSDFDSAAIAPGANRAEPMAEMRLDCLDQCLQQLLSGERDLILEYYRGEQGREKIQRRRQLAERLALSLNALSIRACRIRERIEDCVTRCAQQS